MGSTKSGLSSAKICGDEDGFVRVVVVAVIRDRNGGGIASNLHGPVEDRVERIARDEDGYGALRMVRHIEQGAVRRQGAAPRLGAHRDLPATTLPSTRSTTETVPLMPLVTYAAWSFGWTATQRGSWPTAISASLYGDVIAIRVFHLND